MTQPLILSGSCIAAFWRCPQKWAYEYIERRPHSSSIRQVIGVSTHKAAGVNFERKVETEVAEPLAESLNTAYDLTESRPWWKQRLTAISLTVALSVLIILALVLVVAGGHIGDG